MKCQICFNIDHLMSYRLDSMKSYAMKCHINRSPQVLFGPIHFATVVGQFDSDP